MTESLHPCERARTILASSTSAHVIGAGDHEHLVLCAEPVGAGARAHQVQVEVADAAPVATRERIRGRVRISGAALPAAGCGALHVHPSAICLDEDGHRVDIGVADLLAADPDPLHAVEASALTHLEARHGDVLTTLTRLVDARLLQGVVRVWPYRLDRLGLCCDWSTRPATPTSGWPSASRSPRHSSCRRR